MVWGETMLSNPYLPMSCFCPIALSPPPPAVLISAVTGGRGGGGEGVAPWMDRRNSLRKKGKEKGEERICNGYSCMKREKGAILGRFAGDIALQDLPVLTGKFLYCHKHKSWSKRRDISDEICRNRENVSIGFHDNPINQIYLGILKNGLFFGTGLTVQNI